MNNKNTEKATYVLLDSRGQGLAVEGYSASSLFDTRLPRLSVYSAHAVYDATNDRILKWRTDSDISVQSMLPTMQLLAANPKGVILRGRSALAATLVAAYTGKVKSDEEVLWLRIGVADSVTGVCFPPVHLLHDMILHPEDRPLLDLVTKAAAEAAINNGAEA